MKVIIVLAVVLAIICAGVISACLPEEPVDPVDPGNNSTVIVPGLNVTEDVVEGSVDKTVPMLETC